MNYNIEIYRAITRRRNRGFIPTKIIISPQVSSDIERELNIPPNDLYKASLLFGVPIEINANELLWSIYHDTKSS